MRIAGPVPPALAARLAEIHAEAFASGAPAPWSAAALAASALTGVLLVDDPERPAGFALIRAAAGEAELLTLAVAGAARRRGHGRALLAGAEAAARAAGAGTLFLEVAARNAPARALYAQAGYGEIGRRAGYYRPGDDAIVLAKPLA